MPAVCNECVVCSIGNPFSLQVLRNCDELFDREEFSAAPDPGWPDCFNSGVFVFTPSKETFSKLIDFAKTRGSFDGRLCLHINTSSSLYDLLFPRYTTT